MRGAEDRKIGLIHFNFMIIIDFNEFALILIGFDFFIQFYHIYFFNF